MLKQPAVLDSNHDPGSVLDLAFKYSSWLACWHGLLESIFTYLRARMFNILAALVSWSAESLGEKGGGGVGNVCGWGVMDVQKEVRR